MAKKLCHVSDVEAAHQIEAMYFDGSYADFQLVGDFSVCQSLSDQAKDLLLSRRQSGCGFASPRRAFFRSAFPCDSCFCHHFLTPYYNIYSSRVSLTM